MYNNKCETENGERFGHPDAIIGDFLYQVPVTFISGLNIVAGEVMLDSQGLVIGWQFTDCQQWNHCVTSEALESLTIYIESECDYIGGQYVISKKGTTPWEVSYTRDDEVNCYAALCDAAGSVLGDFSRYMIPVKGYR